MQQVVQGIAGGSARIVNVPRPTTGPTEVLVAPSRTLLSVGTERALRRLATAGLVAKAKARPDLVRDVVRKARADGLGPTARAIRGRLGEDIPLGYAGAGTVVEVGEAVDGLMPGQRVATGGAGHAELQAVAGLLAVPIPDSVSDEQACFATVGAIALHGLRLADLSPGSKVCVIGLGLLGQLTLRLAQASGHEVVGIDVRPWPVDQAAAAGAVALVETGDETTEAVVDWSRGRGADAVLITAATGSSGPAHRAPALARDRATIVVVGDVGLELSRTPYYEKELTIRFARSYGPGRYDPTYEAWGVDYPVGHVRWTERRNLEAFLDLVAAGRVEVEDLVTHRFPLEQAREAYALLEQGDEPYLGVVLTYPEPTRARPPSRPAAHTRVGGEGIGLVGAGAFARSTLIPSLHDAGFRQMVAVCSASGRSAARIASEAGFATVASDIDEILADPRVDVVVVATPHYDHARVVTAALEAGKHVYCEKPLALSEEELEAVARVWRASACQLMVGFNRRYAPALHAVREHFAPGRGPLVLTYRVNAGRLPDRHWYHDRRQGGRLLGEVCHFVDTCASVVGASVSSVVAFGSGRTEPLLEDDLVVTLRFSEGSVATISYAAGGYAGTPKERLEVLGRGHTAVIDDYRRVILDKSSSRFGGKDKGYKAELRVFKEAVSGKVPAATMTESALSTTAATLGAARSLLTGHPVVPQEP